MDDKAVNGEGGGAINRENVAGAVLDTPGMKPPRSPTISANDGVVEGEQMEDRESGETDAEGPASQDTSGDMDDDKNSGEYRPTEREIRLSNIKSRHAILEQKKLEAKQQREEEIRKEFEKEELRKLKREAKQAEQRRQAIEQKRIDEAEKRRKQREKEAESEAAKRERSEKMLQCLLNPSKLGGLERVLGGAVEMKDEGVIAMSKYQLERLKRVKPDLQATVDSHLETVDALRKEHLRLAALKKQLIRDVQKATSRLEAAQASKYPMDDELLPPIVTPPPLSAKDLKSVRSRPPTKPKLATRPALVKTFDVSEGQAGTVMRIWEFMRAFSSELLLSPFSVDDLVDVIRYEGDNTVMLSEIHVQLLTLLVRDTRGKDLLADALAGKALPWLNQSTHGKSSHGRKTLTPSYGQHQLTPRGGMSSTPKKGLRPLQKVLDGVSDFLSSESVLLGLTPTLKDDFNGFALVTPLTWQLIVRLLVTRLPAFEAKITFGGETGRQTCLALCESMRQHEYFAMPHEHKIALLEFLVDSAYETKRIRFLLKQNMEDRALLETKWKEAITQFNRDVRTEASVRKERAIERLRNQARQEWEAQQQKLAKDGGGSAEGGGGGGGGVMPSFEPTNYIHVNQAVQELLEEDACNGPFNIVDPAEILPMDVIEEDEELDDAAEEALLAQLSRQQMIQRRKEKEAQFKRRMQQLQERKRMMLKRANRDKALDGLRKALMKQPRDYSQLQHAVEVAENANLRGVDEHGKTWMCMELRDAYVVLYELQERRNRAEMMSKFARQLDSKFVRTEPIGVDRYFRRYWCFPGDVRIYIESVERKAEAPPLEPLEELGGDDKDQKKESKAEAIDGKENDDNKDMGSGGGGGDASNKGGKFVVRPVQSAVGGLLGGATGGGGGGGGDEGERKIGSSPSNGLELYGPWWYDSKWYYYESDEEIGALIMSLDTRGLRELALKQALEERFDIAALEAANSKLAAAGPATANGNGECAWRTTGSAYIGRRVRRQFGKSTTVGQVTGWLPAAENEGEALWHILHDDGDSEDLDEKEVKAAMALWDKHSGSGKNNGGLAGGGGDGAGGASGRVSSTSSSLNVKGAVDGDGIADGAADSKGVGSISGGGSMRALKKGAFVKYVNKLKGGVAMIKETGLGLEALRMDVMHREAAMLPTIREKVKGYAGYGKNATNPRTAWLQRVKDAMTIADMSACLVELEDTLHSMQTVDDVIEDGRMSMEAEGWKFSTGADDDIYPPVGKRVRRFFKADGNTKDELVISDGTVTAYLPPPKKEEKEGEGVGEGGQGRGEGEGEGEGGEKGEGAEDGEDHKEKGKAKEEDEAAETDRTAAAATTAGGGGRRRDSGDGASSSSGREMRSRKETKGNGSQDTDVIDGTNGNGNVGGSSNGKGKEEDSMSVDGDGGGGEGDKKKEEGDGEEVVGPLWFIVHDSEEEEVLKERDALRAASYYDDALTEPPVEDDDDEDDDDEDDGDGDDDDASKGSRESGEQAIGDVESEEEAFDDDSDDEPEVIPKRATSTHRPTLWENWGARQAWVKAVQQSKTVAELSMALITLVESSLAFGIAGESIIHSHRATSRHRNAWQMKDDDDDGGSSSGKRASAGSGKKRTRRGSGASTSSAGGGGAGSGAEDGPASSGRPQRKTRKLR